MANRPVIRPATVDDWEALRDARLRALAADPDAFWERYEDAAARPAEQWREQAVTWARDRAQLVLVVDPGPGEPLLGMVGAGPGSDEEPDTVRVWGLWIDPTLRGRGAGSALLEGVAEWAAAAGARCLVLCANADSSGVLDWYARRGFTRVAEQPRDATGPDDPPRYAKLQRDLDP